MKYGLELELFQTNIKGDVLVPAVDLPTDGFPGLVELRSAPHTDVYLAFADIAAQLKKHKQAHIFSTTLSEHTYSREHLASLRKRMHYKREADIQNIYGKKPRRLGNKTIASLQLNISGYTYTRDGLDHYSLLDVSRIVKALDYEFSLEIKESGRQPGEYCIKDNIRLEYRSLPNTLFFTDWAGTNNERRILSALKGAGCGV